jgi:mRNA-degrading endonuclease toxin of MazEF toxin-antitoxin module
MTRPSVRRRDLFRANLNPIVGREQAGDARSVLVISNDGFNRAADVVTVLPLTRLEGKKRRVYPYEVLLPERVAGNPAASIIMPQQVRTLSKARLMEKLGGLRDPLLQEEIETRLLEHLGIDFEPDVG